LIDKLGLSPWDDHVERNPDASFAPPARCHVYCEERFARDAKLATTGKGEAMISIAVTWTADVLRQLIAEG
jgi:hypothetical protein